MDARNIDGSTPLCDACAAGSLECVKLLLEYGATVNPPLFTFSPLHEACMGGAYCYIQPHAGIYFEPCIYSISINAGGTFLVIFLKTVNK